MQVPPKNVSVELFNMIKARRTAFDGQKSFGVKALLKSMAVILPWAECERTHIINLLLYCVWNESACDTNEYGTSTDKIQALYWPQTM
jgi:hypothetical protein